MKQPNPNSLRSKRRKVRGFQSLSVSSRKHRRALRRQLESRNIDGVSREPGEKIDVVPGIGSKSRIHTAGGAMKYH